MKTPVAEVAACANRNWRKDSGGLTNGGRGADFLPFSRAESVRGVTLWPEWYRAMPPVSDARMRRTAQLLRRSRSRAHFSAVLAVLKR
jgi:hypothetical protein